MFHNLDFRWRASWRNGRLPKLARNESPRWFKWWNRKSPNFKKASFDKKKEKSFDWAHTKKVFCILPPFVGATPLDITTFRIKTLSVTILQEILACNLKKDEVSTEHIFPAFCGSQNQGTLIEGED
jgi:hypothetical protein